LTIVPRPENFVWAFDNVADLGVQPDEYPDQHLAALWFVYSSDDDDSLDGPLDFLETCVCIFG